MGDTPFTLRPPRGSSPGSGHRPHNPLGLCVANHLETTTGLGEDNVRQLAWVERVQTWGDHAVYRSAVGYK